MSATPNSDRFDCSFCSQTLQITHSHIGKRIACPKCGREVWIYPNRTVSIDSNLATTWYYKKLKLVLGHQTIGPISGEEFLAVHAAGKIFDDTQVMSPELTDGNWVDLQRLNLTVLKNRIEQRQSERNRKQTAQQRKNEIAAEGRRRLQRAISTAISDGRVTLNERSQLVDFAVKVGIPTQEVDELIQAQSRELVNVLVEEALEDGILDPLERQRIGELAAGLGIQVEPTDEQSHRLHLCELAYQLGQGDFLPSCKPEPGIQLNTNESCIATARFEWFEITQAKRPVGIPLGADNFLKLIAEGRCLLTSKRVLLLGDIAAKKFTITSTAKTTRYSDGILFTRTTGRSIFLRATGKALDCDRWAMLAVYAVTGEPTLGTRPTASFIPEYADCDSQSAVAVTIYQEEPKYTFRLVGDHVGDRSYWIDVLRLGGPLEVRREPHNVYDKNAVMVLNTSGQQLGYLKREVAEWFGPILDRGRQFRYSAYRKPSSGGLIVGVHEL
jgi:uncharacterized membrane protein YebE (DUF533 family)